MGHILFVLVVFLMWNITKFLSTIKHEVVVLSVIRTFSPVSFGVYILMSLPKLKKKVTTKAHVCATNRHTNPPSTLVSLLTDTAEHAPKPKHGRAFRSDSTNKQKRHYVITAYCIRIYLQMHAHSNNSYRYKPKFLYTVNSSTQQMNIVYTSTVDVACPLFSLFVNSLVEHIIYVEILQKTIIHLLYSCTNSASTSHTIFTILHIHTLL